MNKLEIIDDGNDLDKLDLDSLLNIDENRQLNKFGLYRLNCLIIGGTGSGKTTHLIKALLNDVVDDFGCVLVLLPEESLDSGLWKKINDSMNQKNKLRKRFIFMNIEEGLPSVSDINYIAEKLNCKIAVVLDDFINAFSKIDWLMLKRYITQLSRVGKGCSLFCLIQDVNSLPAAYRKNFNTFVIFPQSLTYLQFSNILSNYFSTISFSTDEKKDLYSNLKRYKHLALTLINNNQENNSIKINFHDVILNNQ